MNQNPNLFRRWIVLLPVLLSPLSAQTISFGAAQNYPVGWAPVGIVAGDFNGDGKTDLITISSPDLSPFPQISLLAGNGDGTFQKVRYASTPKNAGPTAMVAGDFNRDGHLDLAVAAMYYEASPDASVIWVLLGNGDGTFQPAIAYPFQGKLSGLAAGYLNRDRNLDLVASDAHAGNVVVLRGNGDGTFKRLPGFSIGVEARAVAIGDFDGDHRADVAIASTKGANLWVARGNGDGTFQPPVSYAVPNRPLFAVIADLDGDGRQDIAAADRDNTVSVLMGQGDGTFQTAVVYGNIPTPSQLAVSDFNLDGHLDLAAPNNDSANSITVLPGNGDGTFAAPLTFYINHRLWSMTPIALVAADFNGDGKPDIAVADYDFAVGSYHNSYVSIFLNTTTLVPKD